MAAFWGNAKHQYRYKKGKTPKQSSKQVILNAFPLCPKPAATHTSVFFQGLHTARFSWFCYKITHFQQIHLCHKEWLSRIHL